MVPTVFAVPPLPLCVVWCVNVRVDLVCELCVCNFSDRFAFTANCGVHSVFAVAVPSCAATHTNTHTHIHKHKHSTHHTHTNEPAPTVNAADAATVTVTVPSCAAA